MKEIFKGNIMNDNLIKEIDETIAIAVNDLNLQGISITPLFGDIKNHLGNIDPYSVTDLTYLKSHGGKKEITELCQNAVSLKSKTVCVNSINAVTALNLLKDTEVEVIVVEGFPFGATNLDNLIKAANHDFEIGVSEVDIVFPHVFMSDKDYVGALNYLQSFRKEVKGVIKVILETSDYTKTEIAIMSLICKEAQMDFVKTSTGFSTGGATLHDVALLRRCVGNKIGVKASGGIKTTEDAMRMIEHGATRIGASSLKNTNPQDY